jgi:hypothetical protein
MLTASTAARAPKRLGFSMPAPRETIRTSAAQCRGGFRKKVFGPPFLQGRKGGVGRAFESKNLFPKIASPVASRRFGPSQESDTGALGIASSEIDATAACMYIGRNASDAHGRACARGRAHGDLHQWRRRKLVWIRSPSLKIAGSRCGSGSGVGYGTRKWRESSSSILDHRETAAGVSRLPRTLCESFGER